ncbi:MAG: hypothetical protein HZB39_01180 [Planctomycetes bacterium]|nr:hypothetical protein [Planctomycetota bacterium]
MLTLALAGLLTLTAPKTQSGAEVLPFRLALERATPEQRPLLEHLIEGMPETDRGTLTDEFLLAEVDAAVQARAAAPWGARIPEDVFRDAVLPYAHVTETREPWRASLRARCLPMILGCTTPGAAALRINERLFAELGVRYATTRKRADQSPSESIAQGVASCTGLSILLADACRSVGVPARLAGIAQWPGSIGNHTWVEIWDDDGWHFVGAAEPDPAGLDRAWFVSAAGKAVPGDPRHGIWALSWRKTGTRFPLAWARGEGSWAVDVTARYAQIGAPLVAPGEAALRSAATAFFAAKEDARAQVVFDVAADAFVSAHEDDARAIVASLWRDAPGDDEARADFAENVVRTVDRKSAYTTKTVGERGPKGFALVIAMHGGGGVPAEVNDSQWRHMQIYYRDHPEAGGYRYVALRAPNDAWNGFYDDAIAPLVVRLIGSFVRFGDVDPDKVFAIGYSHGGYGAFVLGPKLPDRFAAVHASASAPTDGETMAVNLRNLRFSFMVGEKDGAYGRLERCNAFEQALAALRQTDPSGYPTSYSMIAGNGHTGLPDRDRLAELLPLVRDAAPKRIAWQTTDAVITDQFWLRMQQPADGRRLDARFEDERLVLDAKDCGPLAIGLDRRLLGEREALIVERDGKRSEIRYAPSARTLCEDLLRRGDPSLAFPMRVVVE